MISLGIEVSCDHLLSRHCILFGVVQSKKKKKNLFGVVTNELWSTRTHDIIFGLLFFFFTIMHNEISSFPIV